MSPRQATIQLESPNVYAGRGVTART